MMRGRAARLARQAHNLEVVGSNPTPASIFPAQRYGSVLDAIPNALRLGLGKPGCALDPLFWYQSSAIRLV